MHAVTFFYRRELREGAEGTKNFLYKPLRSLCILRVLRGYFFYRRGLREGAEAAKNFYINLCVLCASFVFSAVTFFYHRGC